MNISFKKYVITRIYIWCKMHSNLNHKRNKKNVLFSFDIDATVIIIFLDNGRDFIIAGNMFSLKRKIQ